MFVQEEGHYFVKEDFSLLENVEYEKRVKQVEELVDKIQWTDVDSDDLTRFCNRSLSRLFAFPFTREAS